MIRKGKEGGGRPQCLGGTERLICIQIMTSDIGPKLRKIYWRAAVKVLYDRLPLYMRISGTGNGSTHGGTYGYLHYSLIWGHTGGRRVHRRAADRRTPQRATDRRKPRRALYSSTIIMDFSEPDRR
jgi:hypothetical protein